MNEQERWWDLFKTTLAGERDNLCPADSVQRHACMADLGIDEWRKRQGAVSASDDVDAAKPMARGAEKPFPMPGTVWTFDGAEQTRPSGPHTVAKLNWFLERVEAIFADGSHAGVEHMMGLDAWQPTRTRGQLTKAVAISEYGGMMVIFRRGPWTDVEGDGPIPPEGKSGLWMWLGKAEPRSADYWRFTGKWTQLPLPALP